MCVFGESGRLGLLRGEEALLLLGEIEGSPPTPANWPSGKVMLSMARP
jgi:hypothetical protein